MIEVKWKYPLGFSYLKAPFNVQNVGTFVDSVTNFYRDRFSDDLDDLAALWTDLDFKQHAASRVRQLIFDRRDANLLTDDMYLVYTGLFRYDCSSPGGHFDLLDPVAFHTHFQLDECGNISDFARPRKMFAIKWNEDKTEALAQIQNYMDANFPEFATISKDLYSITSDYIVLYDQWDYLLGRGGMSPSDCIEGYTEEEFEYLFEEVK